MPVQGAASRPVRLRELSLKQEPAGHAPAWRKHWAVPDRDSYERLEVPAISHISQRGPAAGPLVKAEPGPPRTRGAKALACPGQGQLREVGGASHLTHPAGGARRSN